MKKLIFSLFLFLSVRMINAQINAITESGDEVVLLEDGTWKYLHEEEHEETEVPLNQQIFSKSALSTFLVKSSKVNVGIWINPKVWTFTKGGANDVFEYQFRKKQDDLYAMLITERLQIPIESLKTIAIENAKKAAPDIKVVKEEYRVVNGQKVLLIQLAGTIQGIKFVYYGYYYSNESGTIQLLNYTSENLLKSNLLEIELFLNGFVSL
jgi:hypothetical protein